MKKFRPLQPDPYIVKPGSQEIAKFGHLNALIDQIETDAQLQANWTETNTTSPSFIRNKPAVLQQLGSFHLKVTSAEILQLHDPNHWITVVPAAGPGTILQISFPSMAQIYFNTTPYSGSTGSNALIIGYRSTVSSVNFATKYITNMLASASQPSTFFIGQIGGVNTTAATENDDLVLMLPSQVTGGNSDIEIWGEFFVRTKL